MDKKDIIKKFKDKGYNDETIEYLMGAIDEFEMFLSQYVSTEELVDRVCNNLDSNIVFENLSEKGNSGLYNLKEKKITIDTSLSEKEKKATFFHEFLHCITTTGKNSIGFCQIDEFELWDFNRGINEGIISYLTDRRNLLLGEKEKDSYFILKQQTGNIIDILSEEVVLECLFNNPRELNKIFEDHNLDYHTITDCFDEIYRKTKGLKETPEEKLLDSIFGKKSIIEEEKKTLINCLLQDFESMEHIKTIEELEEKISLFIKLKKQLGVFDMYNVFSKIRTGFKSLSFEGISEEQLNQLIEEYDFKEELSYLDKVDELLLKDKNEIIISLKDIFEKKYDDFLFIEEYFEERIKNHLFKPDLENLKSSSIENLSLSTIGKIGYFLEKNPEIDWDEIEIIEVSYEDKEEMYETIYILKSESGKIGVIGEFFYEDGRKVSDDTFLLKEGTEDKDLEMEVKVEDEKIHIQIDKEGFQEAEVEQVIPSNLQNARNLYKNRKKTIEEFETLNVPDFLKKKSEKMLKEAELNIKEIEEKIKERKEKVLQGLINKDNKLGKKLHDAQELERKYEGEKDKKPQKKDD